MRQVPSEAMSTRSQIQAAAIERQKMRNELHVSDPRHPIWGAVKFATIILAVVIITSVVLASNASDFDVTEYKSIVALTILIPATIIGIIKGIDYLSGRTARENDIEKMREVISKLNKTQPEQLSGTIDAETLTRWTKGQ